MSLRRTQARQLGSQPKLLRVGLFGAFGLLLSYGCNDLVTTQKTRPQAEQPTEPGGIVSFEKRAKCTPNGKCEMKIKKGDNLIITGFRKTDEPIGFDETRVHVVDINENGVVISYTTGVWPAGEEDKSTQGQIVLKFGLMSFPPDFIRNSGVRVEKGENGGEAVILIDTSKAE